MDSQAADVEVTHSQVQPLVDQSSLVQILTPVEFVTVGCSQIPDDGIGR